MHEQKQIYSFRKLSVGLASVIVGTCFFISNGQNVKADTVNVGEQPTSTVIQQDSSKKQEQDSNEQNAQTNVSNSKTEQQQSTPSAKDVENVDSNLNNTDKLDNAPKPVKSEANQKFDQVKDKFKQDTSIDADVPSSVAKDVKKIQTNTLKVVKEFTVNPNSLSLKESKAVNLNTNGGFDEATWGTLDVNNWKGNVQGDYYQLTDYTGDANHVIVPNEADFEKAGISTSGKQVGVTSDLMYSIFKDNATAKDATVAFSKTGNKMVKAIGTDWHNTWRHHDFAKAELSKFDGTNLDVSNVTDMSYMFCGNQISDVSSLANWDISNVTDMENMFSGCDNLSDISPLANWDTSNVTNMEGLFENCSNLSDISPLANWNTSKVTSMRSMFDGCDNLSDISPLANWDISNVTDMENMFSGCDNLSDISPLANWDTSNVTNMEGMFVNCSNLSDISPLANWDTSNVTKMDVMFENCSNLSDISPLANWDTSKVTDMTSMFENTPLKKVTLTNWDFSNSDPAHSSIFPYTNFEATLSDKTSKSLLGIASEELDSVKDILKVIDSAPIVDGVPDVEGRIQDYLNSIKQKKEGYQQQLAYYKQQIDYYKKELADPNADAGTKENNQHELNQAEQKYQYYLTGDGKKEYDGQIQDLQGRLEQYKQELQQEITPVKLQAEYPLDSVFGNHSKITTPNRDLLVYLVGKLPVKSAVTRTFEITFPDGTKKTINQSIGYGQHAISGTADMATHKLDMAMLYELSKPELIKKEDGSYDLVKAHVDKNGVASFDNVALPKVAGYKAVVTPAKQNAINPMAQMFMVNFVALPKQPDTDTQDVVVPTDEDTSDTDLAAVFPAEVDTAELNTAAPVDLAWHIVNPKATDVRVPYKVVNSCHELLLPRKGNYKLYLLKRGTSAHSLSFVYLGKHTKYVFNITLADGRYCLAVGKIKQTKVVVPVTKITSDDYATILRVISYYLGKEQ